MSEELIMPTQRRSFWILVVWAVAVILIELVTGICASVFINPLSTPWYTLLVAWVPINMACLLYRQTRFKGINYLTDLSLLICFLYTLCFVPILIPSLLFFWTGFGLMGLTPLVMLIGMLRLRSHLKKAGMAFPKPWAAPACGGLILLIIYLPTLLVQFSIESIDDSPLMAKLMRQWGD